MGCQEINKRFFLSRAASVCLAGPVAFSVSVLRMSPPAAARPEQMKTSADSLLPQLEKDPRADEKGA